jgi:hypothetical protein
MYPLSTDEAKTLLKFGKADRTQDCRWYLELLECLEEEEPLEK